ncbi:MAG: hypothetical protein JW884_10810, partial [Deltaproteobacteria bacterium]|nr:hypothetical protein [Deltaproteobacteria bacterium]
MKHLVLSFMAFLFIVTAGQGLATDQLTIAASKIEIGIINTLEGIGKTLAHAAKETGKAGVASETDIRKLLQACMAGKPYAIDSTFIDSKGIMKFVEPK